MSVLAPTAAPVAAAPVAPPPTLYRLSVDQYLAMARHGILTTNDRVELLEGLLVEKMTKHPPHTFSTQMVRDILGVLVPDGWFVNDQEPVTTDASVPEPDVSVIRGTRRASGAGIPQPQDVALVVEVSDSTLAQDRGLKKRIYARAGIVMYWIVNIPDSRIEVYTDPTGPTNQPDYLRRQDFTPTAEVPILIEGQEVGRFLVSEVLL